MPIASPVRTPRTSRSGRRLAVTATAVAASASLALIPAVAGPAAAASGASNAASATTRAARPLTGVVIGLDAGHNGGVNQAWLNHQVNAGFGLRKPCNTTGTQTAGGYTEHAHNYDVVMRLRARLVALGATVVLTRSSDTGLGPCIDQRAAILTHAHTALNISVHADGNLARGARGFHVIEGTRAVGGARVVRQSQQLAVVMRNAFQATGMPRSTYVGHGTALSARDDLAATNLATAPTVMFETGNMRNRTDAALLGSPTFRQREADAMVAGIRTWLHR